MGMFERFRRHDVDEVEQDPARHDRRRREYVEIEQKKSSEDIHLIVRNNSRITTMQKLLDRMGSKATSGRYFVPEDQNVSAITEWCAGQGLFVKKSDLGSVVVLDIMTDKDLRYK